MREKLCLKRIKGYICWQTLTYGQTKVWIKTGMDIKFGRKNQSSSQKIYIKGNPNCLDFLLYINRKSLKAFKFFCVMKGVNELINSYDVQTLI